MASAAGTRDPTLDAVKGFLVVVMALYHALNYFADAPASVYGWLRFVNGAFVFLAGYVVAVFHAGASRADPGAAARLAWRGVKLLLLFSALNLAVGALGLASYRQVEYSVAGYLAHAGRIYAGGEDVQVAFRILVPIGYLLLLASLWLLRPAARRPLAFAALAAAALYTWRDAAAPNVFFVLTGGVGLALGFLVDPARVPTLRRIPVIVAGLLALSASMNLLSGNALAYGLGLALLLKLVQDLARHLPATGRTLQVAARLGRYSLLGYIGQIALLFVLHRALRVAGLAGGVAWLPAFGLTCLALVAACTLLDRLRPRTPWIERTYRMVFA